MVKRFEFVFIVVPLFSVLIIAIIHEIRTDSFLIYSQFRR
ncbi:hypothetical protein U14_00514 [Candidatus Moduliflexus flocculans]|uniref:Uncharacterized protein n=1 Tax=Candidatus Moduliflexus flocculans TaxID=1499966 RepID=A0A0S6VQ44_9BACT|nr:hypothetical protein U14_00514 [Candidatus Moduliflexus flocculans]